MAEVTVADPESQVLQVRVPPAPSTQVVDVLVQNVLGDAIYPNAFVYVDESLTEFDVLGLFPNRLEVNGSQNLTLSGTVSHRPYRSPLRATSSNAYWLTQTDCVVRRAFVFRVPIRSASAIQ